MLLAAWTALLAYVAARTAGVPALAGRLPPRHAVPAVVLLWAVFPLGRALRGTAAGFVGSAAMYALATVFLVAVALAAVDALTAFGLLLPRRAPRLRGWAALAGLAMAAVALAQGTRPPVVSTHEVRLAGLPADLDGTTVVALSDLHLGDALGEAWLEARAAQVSGLRPDVVVLVGDVLEGRGRDLARFVPGLARLRGALGSFAVTGNHENHGGEGTATAAFAAAGFEVLRDGWAEAAPGLVIAGVDDRRGRRTGAPAAAAVGEATAGRPRGALVLLSHSPRAAPAAAAAGVGLMLSGHTHGGQIWPFGHLVRRVYRHVEGRHAVGGMTLLVGRGAGTWGPRMRLWKPGEILRVVLRAGGAGGAPAGPALARPGGGTDLPGQARGEGAMTDVIATATGDLRITFIGHGTLMFEHGGRVVHVDPWGEQGDYGALPKADLVLVTHEHFDHLDPEAVAAASKRGTVLAASPAAAERLPGAVALRNGDRRELAGVTVEAVPAYNVVHLRAPGTPFHPKGAGNGYVIDFGGTRVYVAGDTENTAEMKALAGIDVAFLPMNLPYTMTPEMVADAAAAFRPRILYPYHYGDTDPGRLAPLLEGTGVEVRVRPLR